MNALDRLGATLAKEMKKTVQANRGLGFDRGRMKEVLRDGDRVLDLLSDLLRQPIPYGSYSVLNGVTLHDGDRVMLAWIGSDPVILGRLVST